MTPLQNHSATEASADIVGGVFAQFFTEQEALRAAALEIEDPDHRLAHRFTGDLVNTGCDRLAVVNELLPESPTERVAARIEALEQEKQALLEERDDLRHRNQGLERELADWKENGIRAPLTTPEDGEEEPF